MTPTCNICGGTQFETYRSRKNEKCKTCGAKARHRIGLEIYHKFLFPFIGNRPEARVLHMAPEAALHAILKQQLGERYETSDAAPERYPHADCMKLFFPNDFSKFDEGTFAAILHNHVLEHIPGSYKDHLPEFVRLLEPGGRMIFSVPGPYKGVQTKEGGENLASDAERLEHFLQEDHFKIFGDDFLETLAGLQGGKLIDAAISDERRAELAVRPRKAPFFIWEKFSAA